VYLPTTEGVCRRGPGLEYEGGNEAIHLISGHETLIAVVSLDENRSQRKGPLRAVERQQIKTSPNGLAQTSFHAIAEDLA